MREVLNEHDLGELEQEQEPEDDEEVTPPDVRHVQPETDVDIVATDDEVLSRGSAVKRANLVGAKTVSGKRMMRIWVTGT